MVNNKRDEREHKLSTGSLAAGGAVAYFYGLFVLIYKMIKTKDFSNVYVEFGLLMIMMFTMYIYRIMNRDYDIPTTISGKPLPTGSSKEDKRARLSYYIKDTLVFSILMTGFTYKWRGTQGLLFKTENIYLGIIIEGILTFSLFFTFDYLWHEYNVKKYNSYCESLEAGLEDEEYEDDEYQYETWLEHHPFKPLGDQIAQIKCPSCGKEHDMDYPRCPYCKYDYHSENTTS